MNKLLTLMLIVCMASSIEGQISEPTRPGDNTLPTNTALLKKLANHETGTFAYTVEDYFQKPMQSSFRFSPNGKYLSYREKDENAKTHVYVKNTETGDIKRVIEEEDDLVRGYFWANNERILYTKDKGGDENYQLYAVNVDGTEEMALTPYEEVQVQFSEMLDDQDNHIIILMNKENKQIFEPFKIDITNGDLEKLYTNNDPENPIAGYDFDKDGKLRAFTQQQNGTEYVLNYLKDDGAGFEEIMRTNWKDNFSIIGFDYNNDNPHAAYVISNLDSDTDEILLYDLKEGKILSKIFQDETYDAGGLRRSRKRGWEVDYYYYTGEKYKVIPVSKTFKKVYTRFEQAFGDQQFYVTNRTKEEDKYLIYVTSDKLYGKYYMYDDKKREITELFDLMPNLDPADMAEMRPISFKSRDGLTIHGYVTIPNGAKFDQQVPVIVNPHGGPYGPRDTWGFNPETQLFASRGYATLQVNYRGSGGYGKSFFLAGNKQIGRNMLNDLEDAVAYIKKEDWVDQDKIAIYGASYGGLATLGSLVKTPDLYTCGVDYVGVSNLFTFFNSFPPYWKPYLAQVYEQWYDAESEEDQKIMKEVSPALNVDKITKPLFVVQGANDPRVKIEESDQIVLNLRNKGVDVPYMVKYNEGHGFGHEKNRIQLYKSMMGFFAKHLKNN